MNLEITAGVALVITIAMITALCLCEPRCESGRRCLHTVDSPEVKERQQQILEKVFSAERKHAQDIRAEERPSGVAESR